MHKFGNVILSPSIVILSEALHRPVRGEVKNLRSRSG